MKRIVRAELAATLLLTVSTNVAFSHATLERKEASPNATYRGVIQITHGCEGTPTKRVSVTIPEGVIGAKPMPKPGWTLSLEKAPYAKAYPYYHGDISEGVKTINLERRRTARRSSRRVYVPRPCHGYIRPRCDRVFSCGAGLREGRVSLERDSRTGPRTLTRCSLPLPA